MPEALRIVQATIREETAGRFVVAIELANATDSHLHAWATPRILTYRDGTLTLRLAETEPPENITFISAHSRVPRQIVIPARANATLTVEVPKVLRTIEAGTPGLGNTVQEQAIDFIANLEVEIAYADTPFQPYREQDQEDSYLRQLRDHGETARATIPVTPAP
ncbi:hypothetical protein ABZY93_21880 [Streptomyces smyrnaeus]|uniref:hypothetical protein n=1 Tax=Streptomyces smyrnaeus TaxID=1387713 RepID=UPI0033B2EF83